MHLRIGYVRTKEQSPEQGEVELQRSHYGLSRSILMDSL